jgi:hypothetical protein
MLQIGIHDPDEAALRGREAFEAGRGEAAVPSGESSSTNSTSQERPASAISMRLTSGSILPHSL